MGRFKAGESGNPRGRPKGTTGGRVKALMALDEMLSSSRNQRLLVQAFQNEFRSDPSGFFRTYVMPLLPRESKLSLEQDGVVQWQTLLGTTVTKADLEDAKRDRLPGPRAALPKGRAPAEGTGGFVMASL